MLIASSSALVKCSEPLAAHRITLRILSGLYGSVVPLRFTTRLSLPSTGCIILFPLWLFLF